MGSAPQGGAGAGGTAGRPAAGGAPGGNGRIDAAVAVPRPDSGPTPDGPPPDALYAGTPRCDGAGALLCDDFESGTLGKPPSTALWRASGNVIVDDAHVLRGTKAAHFRVGPGHQGATLTHTKSFPAADNTFYLRMFVYFDALPPTTPLLHFSMAWASGPFPSGGKTYTPQMRALGAINRRVFMNEDGGPEMGEYGLDDANPPAGQRALVARQWVCYEMLWKGDTGEMQLWWNEFEHPALHLSATNTGSAKGTPWPTPQPYQRVSIGMEFYQDLAAQADIDMWVDEVVIDKQRIGCQK